MLTELCQELKNWFNDRAEIQTGTYTIENGAVSLDFLLDGQYYRIKGSVLNDGVHQYGVDVLSDETFTGAIWPMKIPQEILDLDAEITAWKNKYSESAHGIYQSENMPNYGYTLKSAGNGSGSITWKSIFHDELQRWRKI